jgi:hypothetical protein
MAIPRIIPASIFVLTACTLMVLAQPCPCDCYFSSDCNGGFCNWGNLSIEDSCFWRIPKPQGNPGAGCTNDYGDWGHCDGICTDSLSANGFTPEHVTDLARGIQVWADAFTSTARAGGGALEASILERLDEIPFTDDRVANGLGRIVLEVMLLSRGPDSVTYPDAGSGSVRDLVVNDLTDRPCADRNGELAIAALLAEMRGAGWGTRHAAQIDEGCLDGEMFAGFCDDAPAECLQSLIGVFGDALGRAGRDGLEEVGLGADCHPGPGDVNGDGVVSSEDLLDLLSAWGPCPNPNDPDPMACPWDFDETETVSTNDLLILLTNWG